MLVAAAAADVAVELPASEEAPLVEVPDPLVVGEPPLLDVVGEGDSDVAVVGLGDDEVEVGVGEEEAVVGAELGVDDSVVGGDVVAASPDDDMTVLEKKEKKEKRRCSTPRR